MLFIKELAEGTVVLANVDYKESLIFGIHEILPNVTGGKAMHENLKSLGDITHTDEEIAFAHGIQKATNKPLVGMDESRPTMGMSERESWWGSTDVEDVGFIVPVVRMRAAIVSYGTPWHSWAVVASGTTFIGHKGWVHATKALAMIGVDLLINAELREEIKAEFKERKGDYVYQGLVLDGPPLSIIKNRF